MIDFLVGSLIYLFKKTLLSCVVKYTFTKINIFFSNVCERAVSPLHFLGKPVSDFVRFLLG